MVILSFDGWQTLFSGDPTVLGQTLRLGGSPFTVVGVLPSGIRFPQIELSPNIGFQEITAPRETMVYEPLTPIDYNLSSDDGAFNFKVIARLRPGVTLDQARAELNSLQSAYSISARLPMRLGIALTPLATDVTHEISGALWLLLAAVGSVLLIACVNLANLQLARTVASEHETAVRTALGATKGQLLMARLAETLLLALIGGVAGGALSFAGVRLLVSLVPVHVPRLAEVRVDLPVLLLAAGLSVAAALVFNILPSLHALRVQPNSALQANSTRTANSRYSLRTRNILVACQVSCTVVLLIVTSLVLRSFSHLLSQSRGFNLSQITLAQVDLYAPQYGDSKPGVGNVKLAFTDRAIAALQRLPGVQSVALTSAAPLAGQTWVDNLTRPDHPVPEAQKPLINIRWINETYFSTMQVLLLAGRPPTSADRSNPYVALISQRTAREGFPGENPIGKTISDIVPDSGHSLTIIGVVADTRINGLKDTAAMVYVPYWDFTPWSMVFLVRSAEPAGALAPEIRDALWSVDPQIAIPLIKSMNTQLDDSVASERFQATVLTSFGVAALLLALLGVYGVLAYSVTLRRQEFGIRIALGSDKRRLINLVLRQAAFPVLLGCGAGLAFALLALGWVRSLLYETPVMDPLAIGGSVCLIAAAAALAAVVPARRAASVDPMRALRIE